MKYTLILLASLLAAASALEESNSSACQGAISMPTFNCNCNNPQPAECPDSPQIHDTSSYTSPAQSCEDVARSKPYQLPSYQWIKNSTFHPVMVYCTATTQCSSCSQGDVGWMRIANFDMSDPNQDCPQGFKQFSTPTRSCGRTLSRGGCQSMHFKTQGVEYSKVCGRVIGYQVGSTSGFYTPRLPNVIDNAYIEGVSVTHGSSPRKHIWSFATALQSVTGSHGPIHVCPCAISNSQMGQYIPSFVGNDYFCDSGNHATSTSVSTVYSSDPLWNGHGCSGRDACCTFNNPPWFCKQLPQPTTDDIEVRVCADEAANNEDSPIRLVELYTK